MSTKIIEISWPWLCVVAFLLGAFFGWALCDMQWRRAEVEKARRERDKHEVQKRRTTETNLIRRLANAIDTPKFDPKHHLIFKDARDSSGYRMVVSADGLGHLLLKITINMFGPPESQITLTFYHPSDSRTPTLEVSAEEANIEKAIKAAQHHLSQWI